MEFHHKIGRGNHFPAETVHRGAYAEDQMTKSASRFEKHLFFSTKKRKKKCRTLVRVTHCRPGGLEFTHFFLDFSLAAAPFVYNSEMRERKTPECVFIEFVANAEKA